MINKIMEYAVTSVTLVVVGAMLWVVHSVESHPVRTTAHTPRSSSQSWSQKMADLRSGWIDRTDDILFGPRFHQMGAPPLDPVLTHAKAIDYIVRTYRVNDAVAEHVLRSVVRYTKDTDIPPSLMLALIAQESSFRPQAASSVGAVGLTQVMPKVHADKLHPGETLTDIDVSVRVGVDVLNMYLKQERGNVRRALQRYNGNLADKNQTYAGKVLHKKVFMDTLVASNRAGNPVQRH